MLSWNLFHGRDKAPDAALHTLRSRLLGVSERNETHAQVNRDLEEEFTTVLAAAPWDVALLQESPPRWAEALARRCDAEPHLVPTSRNLPPPLDRAQHLLARLSPDLIASWEGGSNLTLVRPENPACGPIVERRRLLLARHPERRSLALTRLAGGLCLANLHASEDPARSAGEVWRAALEAARFAPGAPLVFGGDLNLRTNQDPQLFDRLETELGLAPRSSPGRVDHLLVRGIELSSPPAPWPLERREIPDARSNGRLIRLSDHDPLEATLELSG